MNYDKLFQHPFFRDVDRTRAEEIFARCHCSSAVFCTGDIIHSPELDEKRIGMLLAGAASVTTKDPAKNTLLRFLGPGDLFGFANLFVEEPFVSVIRAEKQTTVFFLTEAAVRALLEQDRAFLYHYLSFLSGRVCYLNRKIGYLTAGSAERRLSLYLSAFEASELTLPVSFSALSELLDIGRASLYRAFDRLIADGYIQKEGRRITVPDVAALGAAYQA